MDLKELNQFTEGLNGIVDKLTKGKEVAAVASGEEKTGDITPVSKGVSADTKRGFAGPSLEKSFEYLARVSPEFKHLGADRILEDPRHYLRQKGADDRYLVSDAELSKMLRALMARPAQDAFDNGAVDFGEFTSKSGGLIESQFEIAMKGNAFGGNTNIISKALDTTTGGVLIRVDLEPLLTEAYLRQFPAEEYIEKFPANGIRHSYNQITDIGAAVTISELGDMSSAVVNSTYARQQSTPIAIVVSPRAISLKAQFAVEQSGMNYGVTGGANGNTEIVSAVRAIARKVQSLTFQGNQSVAAKTLNDEEGLTDTNAFDGFRWQLATGSTAITKGGGQAYRDVIDQATGQVINAGGTQENMMIFLSVGARRAINAELETVFLRINDSLGISPFDRNQSRAGIYTVGDYLTRFMNVPAGSQSEGIGYYTFATVATEDMYVMDPAGIGYPYLGSPNPTILELPTGFNHQLSRVFYPFIMRGLMIRVLGFNRKIRINRQIV